MQRLLQGLLLFIAAVSCRAAESHWVHARSANFEISSSANARAVRDTLREFEQVRGFFLQAFGGPPAKTGAIQLVAFGSTKEYEPYRLNEFATAYYHESAGRDYIVMSRCGVEIFPTAVHEYVHLLVRHAGLKFPPWLNEGLAELYSTLRPMGDKILVGDLIQGRYREMLEGKWVALSTILNAGRNSAYYNEKDKAGSLYNEGWALTHMLYFREGYRDKFGELVRAIDSGKDSEETIRQVYGRSVAQLEKDLQSYLHGNSFQGVLVPAKLEKSKEEIAVEPLSAFDSELVLAELNNRAGREQAYQTALEQLMQQDPKRPEPYREMGYLTWRKGNLAGAVPLFEKAYALGDRDDGMLWDYGRLLAPSNLKESVRVLWELMAKDPERLDVRIELATNQLRDNQAQAALQLLQAVRTVTPELAPKYFRAAVYAHLRNGDEESAKATAKRFQAVAKGDEQRAEADALMAQIPTRRVPPPERVVMDEVEDGGRSTLRRAEGERAVPPAPVPPPQRRPSVSGRFVELDCQGAQARMVLQTEGGRQVFLIEDPSKVVIQTGNGAAVEWECGRQRRAVPVSVEYDAPPAASKGTQGVVRALRFE